MRKLIIIIGLLVLSTSAAMLMTNTTKQDDKSKDVAQTQSIVKQERNSNVNVGKRAMPKDHDKEKIDCKSCHDCEYPTRKDPCLSVCPRTDVSVYHSPDEAPDVIVLDNLSNRYGPVVFTHKIHAEMSEMSHGCTGCHHYNTTGPVLKCVKCHEESRIREDLSKPDLEAAFHRQCMTCHRQWSRTTDCNSCHLPKGREGVKKMEELIAKGKATIHPPIIEPEKIVYNTSYEKGKVVTFYHNDHTKLFNLTCVSCHKDENCIKCHDINLSKLHPNGNFTGAKKSFEQHHKPCSSCHNVKNCSKCHSDKEIGPFNHYDVSGWRLGKFHEKLKCSNCHDEKFTKKLSRNCESCHKNFKSGSFNHDVTRLRLDDMHSGFDCSNCHASRDYISKFTCKTCHDDKDYPKFLPGKRLK